MPQKERDKIQKSFSTIASLIRHQLGCLQCSIYIDLENKNIIMLYETWNTKEDFHRHVRSIQYKKILALMELSVKLPEIRFHAISEQDGIEVIQAIRK
jgi:quinol monooxygenase YgiN